MYLDQPWPGVYAEWRERFLYALELADSLPEQDLLEPGRYPWFKGNPLSGVLEGTFDHFHEEHYGPLTTWLAGHGIR
jgi:hypothetical protein